jgi:hypothetical protein
VTLSRFLPPEHYGRTEPERNRLRLHSLAGRLPSTEPVFNVVCLECSDKQIVPCNCAAPDCSGERYEYRPTGQVVNISDFQKGKSHCVSGRCRQRVLRERAPHSGLESTAKQEYLAERQKELFEADLEKFPRLKRALAEREFPPDVSAQMPEFWRTDKYCLTRFEAALLQDDKNELAEAEAEQAASDSAFAAFLKTSADKAEMEKIRQLPPDQSYELYNATNKLRAERGLPLLDVDEFANSIKTEQEVPE